MNTNATQRKRNPGWIKKTIPWAVTVIIIGGGATYWTMQNHVKAATTPTVRWLTVQKGNVQKTVSLSGTLNPANEVSLTGSGKITSISVKAGQKVQAGQVIAQLDTSSYKIQLQEAQANLKSAEAKLAQAEEPTTVQNGKFGTTPQNPDPNSVAQAQASVEQAQAQVTNVEQQVNACTIKSPISGTVLEVDNPSQTQSTTSSGMSGNSSTSGSGNVIATVADLSPSDFEVQATVDQADAANIHAGQTATVSLGTTVNQTVTGKVVSISYVPQTQSGVTTYPVTIQLEPGKNFNETLLPGESVAATVVEQQANNVLMLPTAAITQRRGTSGVYISSSPSSSASASTGYTSSSTSANSFNGQNIPSGLQFQPITVGLYGGNYVEVKSGLTQSEQVAVVVQTTSSSSSSQHQNSGSGFAGTGMTGGFGGMQGSFSGHSFGGSRGSYSGGGQSFSRGGNG